MQLARPHSFTAPSPKASVLLSSKAKQILHLHDVTFQRFKAVPGFHIPPPERFRLSERTEMGEQLLFDTSSDDTEGSGEGADKARAAAATPTSCDHDGCCHWNSHEHSNRDACTSVLGQNQEQLNFCGNTMQKKRTRNLRTTPTAGRNDATHSQQKANQHNCNWHHETKDARWHPAPS